jgi:hypothetical protein
MIEKKLILCAILAITIGIATIVPLGYFMAANAQTTPDKPWFNLNVPYACFKANSTDTTYDLSYLIAFNCTVNDDVIKQHTDARIEYYQIDVYCDQGSIANFTYFVGTNRTETVDPLSFSFVGTNWFNTTTSGGGGMFPVNLNSSIPFSGISGANSGSTQPNGWQNSTVGQQILLIENANAVYIDVHRLGYVTFDGNSIIATLADNAVTQHIELTKNSNEFLYNTGISPNQLPQYGYAPQNP